MRYSEQTTELFAALAELQAGLTPPPKNRTVEIQTDKGKYSFAYAELGTIWTHIAPLWKPSGLFWISDVQSGERGPKLVTRIGHKSGQWMESDFPLPQVNNTKQFAGEITYARRYSFSMMLGLASQEDADEMPANDRGNRGRDNAQPRGRQAQHSHTPSPAAPAASSGTGAGKQPQDGARISPATPSGSGGNAGKAQAPAAPLRPGQQEREEIVELCASNHWPAERVPEYLKYSYKVQRLDQLTMEQYGELKKVISGPATFEEVMALVMPKPGDFGFVGPAPTDPGAGG